MPQLPRCLSFYEQWSDGNFHPIYLLRQREEKLLALSSSAQENSYFDDHCRKLNLISPSWLKSPNYRTYCSSDTNRVKSTLIFTPRNGSRLKVSPKIITALPPMQFGKQYRSEQPAIKSLMNSQIISWFSQQNAIVGGNKSHTTLYIHTGMRSLMKRNALCAWWC